MIGERGRALLLLSLAMLAPLTLLGTKLSILPEKLPRIVQSIALSPGPSMLADARYNNRLEAVARWNDGSEARLASIAGPQAGMNGRARIHFRHLIKEARRLSDAQLTEAFLYFFCRRTDFWGWKETPVRVEVRLFAVRSEYERRLEVSCNASP